MQRMYLGDDSTTPIPMNQKSLSGFGHQTNWTQMYLHCCMLHVDVLVNKNNPQAPASPAANSYPTHLAKSSSNWEKVLSMDWFCSGNLPETIDLLIEYRLFHGFPVHFPFTNPLILRPSFGNHMGFFGNSRAKFDRTWQVIPCTKHGWNIPHLQMIFPLKRHLQQMFIATFDYQRAYSFCGCMLLFCCFQATEVVIHEVQGNLATVASASLNQNQVGCIQTWYAVQRNG